MASFHERLRRFIEDRLPWFDSDVEEKRDARTESIRKRSAAARAAGKAQRERIIGEYRKASRTAVTSAEAAEDAGEAVIAHDKREGDA